MRILFYCGVILIALGLLATAVETAARGLFGADKSFFMSAYDLWYTLRPKSLLIFEMRTERLAPWLWNPIMSTVLAFPAWFIFGIPGGILVWFCHPKRSNQANDDINEVLESFTLFDELTRQARQENPEGEEHGPRDMLPDDLMGEDIGPDANAPGEFIDNASFTETDGKDDGDNGRR